MINDRIYCWEDGIYQYEVKLPEYLKRDDASVTVSRLDNELGGYSIELHIGRSLTREYEYHVFITECFCYIKTK